MTKGLNILKNYPLGELYRLVVDGQFHARETGWLGYEGRQPGSLKAAFSGLALAITNLEDKTLTLEYIKELHKKCTTNVHNLEDGTTPGHIRRKREAVGFYIPPRAITKNGLVEIFNLLDAQTQYSNNHSAWIGPIMEVEVEGHVKPLKKIDHIIAIHHDNIQNKREMAFVDDNQKLANTYDFLAQSDRFNYYIAPRSDHLGRDIQQEIEIYQSALEKAANDDEKLQAIVNLIWMCDHIHPFFDVNIRTFAITLLTRLLLQNGFPPATFEDPNRFDGFSKKEMLVEVKKAMQNTIDITNGKKDLFGFNSDAIPTAEQDKLVTNYAAEFVAAINKEYSKQAVLAIKNDIQREWSKGHTVFSNPAGDEGMPEQVTKQWQLIRQAEKNGNYEEVLQQLMETRKQAASSNLVDTTKQTHKP